MDQEFTGEIDLNTLQVAGCAESEHLPVSVQSEFEPLLSRVGKQHGKGCLCGLSENIGSSAFPPQDSPECPAYLFLCCILPRGGHQGNDQLRQRGLEPS